jgi:hypothetical protein
MDFRRDPFPLIFASGDEFAKLACLVFFGLAGSPRANECLLNLIKLQRADGAFPSGFDPTNWGMQETIRHTLLFLRTGLPPGGVIVASAVRFVLDRQNPDGGWCENPTLRLPAERTWISSERSITWLTADVVDLLSQVEMAESREFQAAVDWLRSMQNDHGAWPSLAPATGKKPDATGDPDATVQIGFLVGALYGQADPAYRKATVLFEAYLDECAEDVARGYRIRQRDGAKEEPDVYHLTHLFLSWLLDPPRRFQSGYDVADPRVSRMMAKLIDIQREDGGWRPFFAAASSPVYTALAVKVLILSGMVPRENYVDAIKAYSD